MLKRFSAGSGLNDGQWHSVHFLALESIAMLTINGDEMSTVRAALPIQIRTGGDYFFGGNCRNHLSEVFLFGKKSIKLTAHYNIKFNYDGYLNVSIFLGKLDPLCMTAHLRF